MEIEIKEIRKRHYIKFVNGKPVSRSDSDEFFIFEESKKFSQYLDIGTLEISLALAGILGFLITQEFPPLVGTLIRSAFGLSVTAFFSFLLTYAVIRMPQFISSLLRISKQEPFKRFDLLFYPFVIIYPPIFIYRTMTKLHKEKNTIKAFSFLIELCYLILILCAVLTIIAALVFSYLN